MLKAAKSPLDSPLPPLREDLDIMRGGASYSGAPVWLVFDPLRNRFFRITFEMFQLLSHWGPGRTVRDLISEVKARHGQELTVDDVGTVVKMLENNMLLEPQQPGQWQKFHERTRRRHSLFMTLMHNYLFFKIPLVRPESFIRKTWPHVAFLFSTGFLYATVLAGLMGIYLVSRQWEAFLGTFQFVFSLEGVLVSILSVIIIKCLHELGHAYAAHRAGCRIPSMGIAFMILMPLLYTDVSDAWKLKSRRERLAIDTAGIKVELSVAAFALLAWVFIPDGALRSAVFVLAATGWVMSLLVNLNPFMRFDGYYILADMIGVENLQPRSFRHMAWRLREFLFAPGHPPPENFTPGLDVGLTLYAISTAIYRFILYTGIALLVYHFTIKVVGIVLFAVEIGFFILRPVWLELKEWWSMRDDILSSRRTYATLAVAALCLLLFCLPLSRHVSAPAMLMPAQFTRLHPAEAGRIQAINAAKGQKVKKGDVLFVLVTPAISEELRITEVEIMLARQRLARIGVNPDDLAAKMVIEEELSSHLARAQGLRERRDRLTVRAPFDGVITDIGENIHKERWVSLKDQLAHLSGGTQAVIRGYADGQDTHRITLGMEGWFVPDDVTKPRIPITLQAVSRTGAQEIEIPQLASHHHGPVAVYPPSPNSRQRLVPVAAQYAVAASIDSAVDPLLRTVQGVAVFNGQGESLLYQFWKNLLKVLRREAGL
jgi:putative peptide zinc metalloprotease protein